MEKQTLKELVLERSKGYESFQRSLLSFAELGAKWQQEQDAKEIKLLREELAYEKRNKTSKL